MKGGNHEGQEPRKNHVTKKQGTENIIEGVVYNEKEKGSKH